MSRRAPNLVRTSAGVPKSLMTSLSVFVMLTLTLSRGSITSLYTMSCPLTDTCKAAYPVTTRAAKSRAGCFACVVH